MRVAMYYSNSDVRVENIPTPEIGPGELLVKVQACGVCGSDVMEWYRIKKAPLVLGHELAGDIVEIGSDIDGEKFKVGDRVAVTHHVPCNTCDHCLAGHHSVCDTLRTTNFYPGGFSEYLRVPAINVDRGTFTLPEGMSYDEGAFLEPLGCVFRGQRLAGFKPGMSVLIIGSGITGLLYVKLLKALGAGLIATTDISEFKLSKARKFGADHTFNAREDVPSRFREVNNGKLADFVVLCSGATPAVETAFDTVGRGGTILFFAPPGPEAKINFPLFRLWKDEVTTVTSYAASPLDLYKAMELIRAGRITIDEMITHRLPLEEVQAGFMLTARSEENLKVIIEPQN
jgi:L-iditol 2-dehydrogenase